MCVCVCVCERERENYNRFQTTPEGLELELTRFKNRKAAGLDEIPLEVWKLWKFEDQLL